MNINEQNYVIFDDESLIVCDRETDVYLVEITPDFDLYVETEKIEMDERQKGIVKDYYEAQYILFSTRNSIGAKGVQIGIEGVELAVTAVGVTKGCGKKKVSHLACLFAHLLRCGKGYIEWLCTPCHALNLSKNPTQSWDTFFLPQP